LVLDGGEEIALAKLKGDNLGFYMKTTYNVKVEDDVNGEETQKKAIVEMPS